MSEETQDVVYKSLQDKKRAVLIAYSECGNITEACESVGITRQNHYVWMKDDEVYARDFKKADDIYGDKLEAKARERAIDGSDTMLIFLMKGQKPDKYGDKQKITANVNVATKLEDFF